MTTWFHEIWPRTTAATGVGYLAVAYAVSRWLTRRSPALMPIPAEFGACAEALQCTTSDGIPLKGWALAPSAPRATLALFHGLRQNRSHMLNRIPWLMEAGFRCVAFDQRAHGESGGPWTSFGFHESRDVVAVADLIRQRWPGIPAAALGESMGAAALCFAGAAARRFDAIILENLYHDLARAFQHRVGCGYPGWFKHFRRGIIWFVEKRIAATISAIAPIERIAELAPRPVLLLTGSDDPHAPPHEVRALADRLGPSAHFHVIDGAGHENVCEHGGPGYRRLILSFLDEHLLQIRSSLAA